MDVYRIARREYSGDLSGEGARRYGGRWNRKGTAVLYTSESRSLAIVEYLVHLPLSLVRKDVCLARIHLPDEAVPEKFDARRFIPTWRMYPGPDALAELGSAWVRRGRSLALRVPSAVVTGEFNIILNPAHRLFSKVKIREIEPFAAIKRMYGSSPSEKG